MTNAQTTVPVSERAPTRNSWRAPRTLRGTLTLSIIIYLVWQPLVAVALPLLVRTPRLEGRAAWQLFLLILPVLGAIAGTLWWLGGQRPRGALRYWLRSTSRMIGFNTMLMAERIGVEPFPIWCAVLLLTAMVMGALFGWMERWATVPDHHSPA